MKREPEFHQVPFSSLRPWPKNPRDAKKTDVANLAEKIRKKGLFRNFVCWQEPEDVQRKTFTVGGGNIRFFALRDVLKVQGDRKVWISLNYPETEAEKIELSILDNMAFGGYLEQPLAELLYPVKDALDLASLRIPLSEGVDLEKFISGFGPSETEDIVPMPESDRRTISVVCADDDDLLTMRDLLGIDGKTNEIKSEELRRILERGTANSARASEIKEHRNKEKVIRYFMKFFPPKKSRSILDIGSGITTPYRGNLSALTERYVAFDIRASGRVDVVGDVRDMNQFEDGEFEWGWASEIIEHLEADDQRPALTEMLRVCENLVLTFPRESSEAFKGDPGHHPVSITDAEARTIATSSGRSFENHSTKTGRAIFIFRKKKK